MELITILNRCHRFRGFVYHQARFSSDHKSIEISVRPRQAFGRDLLPLPSARARIRSASRTAIRVHPFLGISGLSALLHAARRLPPLPGRRRRGGSLGRRQAHSDQGLYVVSGPLGAPAFVEGNRRGIPHFMGQGFRRRRTRRHLRAGAPRARPDRRHRSR